MHLDDYLKKTLMMLLFRNDLYSSDKRIDINLASQKAYGDMARHTLHLKEEADRDNLKKSGMEVLFNTICEAEKTITTVGEFNTWHRKVCNQLRKVYENSTTAKCGTLTYGQAQKWINMTIKYLLIIYELYGFDEAWNEFFKSAHIPIDSIMYKTVKNELHVDPPKESWSKLDDYSEYLEYQNSIRQAVEKVRCSSNCCFDPVPLMWEMENWTANSINL